MNQTDSQPRGPRHIGIILDGNRRWARQQGQPTLTGHEAGLDQIEPVVKAAFDLGVEVMSLFVFSTENWRRTEKEVKYLMALFNRAFRKESQRLINEGYRLRFAGRRDDKLNPRIRRSIEQMEADSINNPGPTVVFCFNYGGRLELVDAARKLIKQGLAADQVDETRLAAALYQPDIPDLDLLIRTSGESRISGFQLWRASYAEILVVDKYWPDFGPDDIRQAIDRYWTRQRRFGGD